jgi:hypothetical protein
MKAELQGMSEEIVRDGIFIGYDNSVVYDTNSGFEWLAGPDKDTTWYNAKKWVKSLAMDGRLWRMPTKKELRTLYKKKRGTRNMTPLLNTTGWFVWSDDTNDNSLAGYFNFGHGSEYWISRSHSHFSRVFAMRSREKATE